jgi:hypothetical protein
MIICKIKKFSIPNALPAGCGIKHKGNSKLGKRGPKPMFLEVACPNEGCEQIWLQRPRQHCGKRHL